MKSTQPPKIAFAVLMLMMSWMQFSFAQALDVSSGNKVVVSSGTFMVASGGVKIESSNGAIDNSGTIKLAGNWTNNGNGLINGSAGTVIFNGTTSQAIGGSAATTYNNLTVSNSSGVTLSKDATVSGTLTFSSGKIITSANNLVMNAAGSISGAGTGWVVGNLQWGLDASHTSKTFVIGDAGNYTPVAVSFNSISNGGTLTGKTVSTDHPQISSSTVLSSYSVNRYWNLTNSGISFGTSTVTLNWAAGDVDSGSYTGNFIVGKYDSPNWTYPTVTNITSTSIQATGITSFSDFIVGDTSIVIVGDTGITLSINLFIQGFYLGGGKMSPLLKLLNTPGATANDVDTVTVELHNSTSPFALVSTKTGVLKTDGSLSCTFPDVTTGSYYLVIKHRTTLETWSATAVSGNSYDFTTSAAAAYGSQQVSLKDGKYAIYSGDISANGTTTGQDGHINSLDKNELQLSLPACIHGSYTANDLTGDALVDESDYLIVQNNVPLNVAVSHP